MPIDPDQRLLELVTAVPHARDVFTAYGVRLTREVLQNTVNEVAARHQLGLDDLLEELEDADAFLDLDDQEEDDLDLPFESSLLSLDDDFEEEPEEDE